MTKILILLVLIIILFILRSNLKENFKLFVYDSNNPENVYNGETINYYKTPYFCLDYADLMKI